MTWTQGQTNEYYQAVSDMLRLNSTTHAPWTIVEANNKLHARIRSLDALIAAIEAKL